MLISWAELGLLLRPMKRVLWEWFGVLFGATLGWQSVRKDGEAYSHFGRVLCCDTLTTSTRRRRSGWARKIFECQ